MGQLEACPVTPLTQLSPIQTRCKAARAKYLAFCSRDRIDYNDWPASSLSGSDLSRLSGFAGARKKVMEQRAGLGTNSANNSKAARQAPHIEPMVGNIRRRWPHVGLISAGIVFRRQNLTSTDVRL